MKRSCLSIITLSLITVLLLVFNGKCMQIDINLWEEQNEKKEESGTNTEPESLLFQNSESNQEINTNTNTNIELSKILFYDDTFIMCEIININPDSIEINFNNKSTNIPVTKIKDIFFPKSELETIPSANNTYKKEQPYVRPQIENRNQPSSITDIERKMVFKHKGRRIYKEELMRNYITIFNYYTPIRIYTGIFTFLPPAMLLGEFFFLMMSELLYISYDDDVFAGICAGTAIISGLSLSICLPFFIWSSVQKGKLRRRRNLYYKKYKKISLAPDGFINDGNIGTGCRFSF